MVAAHVTNIVAACVTNMVAARLLHHGSFTRKTCHG